METQRDDTRPVIEEQNVHDLEVEDEIENGSNDEAPREYNQGEYHAIETSRTDDLRSTVVPANNELRSQIIPDKIFGLGDLIWCRSGNHCYYPAVVVNDVSLKFCTKILMSTNGGGEGGATRQYNVQMIEDNRLSWVDENHCLPYSGLADYEQVAVGDAGNMKFYKPKPDRLSSWKRCVIKADELFTQTKSERVKIMDIERHPEKGGFMGSPLKNNSEMKTLFPLPDQGDKNERKQNIEQTNLSPINTTCSEAEEQIENENLPNNKQTVQIKETRKEVPYDTEVKTKSLKPSSNSPKPKDKPDTPKKLDFVPVFHSNVKFDRSFKIKKDAKKKEEVQNITTPNDANNDDIDMTKISEGDISTQDTLVEIAKTKQSESSELSLNDSNVSPVRKDKTESYSPCEGALVWAKMRGYPYWPGIVSRDPKDGEFLKITETLTKTSRRYHVLFLEYGNERAWIGASSLKEYKGINTFLADKDKATKKAKADYQVNKRFQANFDKAVDYAQDLINFNDDDRLERVLLNYGWGMVEEKDNTKSNMSDSVAQELDSTLDSSSDMVELSESVPNAEENESLEANSDTVPAKGNKRDFTKVEKNDSDTVTPTVNKKRKQNSDLSKVSQQQTQEKDSAAIKSPTDDITPVKADDAGDTQDFPLVGDLVWGRMPGFPFWPGFITRNPENVFKREKNGKVYSYHVQFFGWNDESGWVSTVLPFNGLEAFKALGAKKKSDKSYKPAKSMQKKWGNAVNEAEETMSLTRQERVDSYFVSYAHKLNATPAKSPAVSKSSPAPKSKTPAKSPAVAKTPTAKNTPQSKSKPKTPISAKGIKSVSKTAKETKTVTPTKPPLPVKNYHGSNKRMAVPSGWMSRLVTRDGKEQVVYISPGNVEFPSKAAMYREISLKKDKLDGVMYLTDSSLPPGWRCQQINSSVYFFSPLGERFENRLGVAERMKTDPKYTAKDIQRVLDAEKSRKPAPKSVLIARGQYQLKQQDEFDDNCIYLPGGLTYRIGGPFDEYLDCDKIFGSSNDRLIEIAQLPQIFLEHPTVRVEDMGNEMIISDMVTGEFIAKKIIYD